MIDIDRSQWHIFKDFSRKDKVVEISWAPEKESIYPKLCLLKITQAVIKYPQKGCLYCHQDEGAN